MAIPEAQLETWAHQGAVAGSRDTYAAIKEALEHRSAPYASGRFSVFLQGSYGNDTNVRAESDVDIVICSEELFHYNIAGLTAGDVQLFHKNFAPATYFYEAFQGEVAGWLAKCFGSDFRLGNKAIEIAARGHRRKADILIANEFRLYRSNGFTPLSYKSGVRFVTGDRQPIVNYPKQHSENLTARHQASNEWLKPTIRIFKNMRNRLVNDGVIERAVAPSYFIEGMLANVPQGHLRHSYADAVVNSVNWLLASDLSGARCVNGIHPLLGNGTATSWPYANKDAFLRAVVGLWRYW